VRANPIRRLEGRMRWAGHVARMGEKWNAFRVLLGTAHYGHIFVFNPLQTLCVKMLFCPTIFQIPERTSFCLKVTRLRPSVLPSSTEIKLSKKHWWNDTDKGKPNFWNLSQFYLVRYESIMGWTVIEPGSATDRLRNMGGLQRLRLAWRMIFKDSFPIVQ